MTKIKGASAPKKSSGNNKLIALGMGCLIVIALLLGGAALLVLGFVPGVSTLVGNDQAAIVPSGLDDNTSPELLLAQREKAETQLNSYGWVDEASGVVRIPVSQAMALVAERGLPVGSEGAEEMVPEESLTPTPEPAVSGETPPEATPVAEEPPATPASESTAAPATEEPPPEPTVNLAEVGFQAHVLPIFEQHCLQCHGGERPEGGLRVEEGLTLSSYEDVMAGSWNGSVIEPGDVENSYLIEQVVTGRMPKEGPRLTPTEIEIISAWVEAGAPDN